MITEIWNALFSEGVEPREKGNILEYVYSTSKP
jgi:hypothetical protein